MEDDERRKELLGSRRITNEDVLNRAEAKKEVEEGLLVEGEVSVPADPDGAVLKRHSGRRRRRRGRSALGLQRSQALPTEGKALLLELTEGLVKGAIRSGLLGLGTGLAALEVKHHLLPVKVEGFVLALLCEQNLSGAVVLGAGGGVAEDLECKGYPVEHIHGSSLGVFVWMVLKRWAVSGRLSVVYGDAPALR